MEAELLLLLPPQAHPEQLHLQLHDLDRLLVVLDHRHRLLPEEEAEQCPLGPLPVKEVEGISDIDFYIVHLICYDSSDRDTYFDHLM